MMPSLNMMSRMMSTRYLGQGSWCNSSLEKSSSFLNLTSKLPNWGKLLCFF